MELVGGLITAWNADILAVDKIALTQHWISVVCTVRFSGKSFRLIQVYGPQLDAEKLQFLADLQMVVLDDLPCILCEEKSHCADH